MTTKLALLTDFQDNIQLKPARRIHENPIIVYSGEVNYVDYTTASINESGLRDNMNHLSSCENGKSYIKVARTP